MKTIKYNLITEADLQNPQIQEMQKQIEKRCCNLCGNMLELRIITDEKNDGRLIEPFCPRCKRIEKGIDMEVYINRLSILVNDFQYMR